MTRNIVRAFGLVILVAAWTPFLGCDLLQNGGSPDNTNDNSTDNTDDNTNDNSAGNTNDNTDDNTNDNSAGNTNDNNDNIDDNANDNATDNGNDNDDDSSANLAVFSDPTNPGFSTSDVRDVNDEIVRFDTSTESIIWAADGTSYQAGAWDVNGVFLAGGGFKVLFGTENGNPHAYFTETFTATICDIRVQGDVLSIFATSVSVPQN